MDTERFIAVGRQDYFLQIQDKRCQFVWIFISYWVGELIPHPINVDIFPHLAFVIQARELRARFNDLFSVDTLVTVSLSFVYGLVFRMAFSWVGQN